MGNSLQMQGKEALAALQKAADLLPGDATACSSLGLAQNNIGQLNDAVASFRRALAIKPDYAEAHSNLGVILNKLGRLDDAVASYCQALAIKPDSAETHYNLGNTLNDLMRLDDAVASYRQALAIKPDFSQAHNNLGKSLKGLGRLDDAVTSYRQALALNPGFALAHSNLGNALKELGRINDAVTSYRRALEIKPDYAEAHNNLGNALTDIGQLNDAVASYRRALEIKPDYAEAYNNLGNALRDLGQINNAVASYHRALEIKPDFTEVRSNLLFTHNYQSDQPAETLLAEAQYFGGLVARQARPYTSWRNLPDPDRCLRVGWVSGDFRNHPVGHFVEGLLAELAADATGRLELFAYPNHFRSDAVTERIKACCHGWHSAVGLSDQRLAERIHDDEIDILIDLSGHSGNNRLPMFAWKPAPLQMTWLGYMGTTGVAAIDYLLADPWALPATEEVHFTEKIWRLPETLLCLTPPDIEIPVSSPPASANGFITFGSFNNLSKINDAVVALWARVLAAVPDSRLLLKTKQLNAPSVRQGVVEQFSQHGISQHRLQLEGSVPQRAEHLMTYQRVDISLDPFPHPGMTTSAESLWMGVPVLTLGAGRFISRQGIGLMTNAGLPDWIAADADDYVAKAVWHASDLPRLAAVRNSLRQRVLTSPIFDNSRFARHFETALRGMWVQWCASRQASSCIPALAEGKDSPSPATF